MIKSGRTVRAAYLENCVVYAGTAILADCAINAQLYSDGAIRIVSGRGTVIGGLLTAVDRVDVNVIGARSGVLTEIALDSALCAYRSNGFGAILGTDEEGTQGIRAKFGISGAAGALKRNQRKDF